MLHKTKGIVLHTLKFTETSVITKIYTEAFGLQSYIVNGVRKSSYGKASLFSPVNILEMEIYRRENKNLQRLKEFRPACIYKTLNSDVLKSSLALFIAEILNKCIREEEPHSALFHFIESSLLALDASPRADSNFHLVFMLRLAGHLGFAPDSQPEGACDYFDLREGKFAAELPDHQYVIAQPHASTFKTLLDGECAMRPGIGLEERNFLLEKILLYYALHLHDFKNVTSHHVLHEVLEGWSV